MEISEKVTHDPTKKFSNPSNALGNAGLDMKDIINEIEEDKSRMIKELAL